MNAVTLNMLHGRLANILDKHVAPMFSPAVRLTIVARLPGNDGADVMVTNDDFDEVVKAVERSKARPDITTPNTVIEGKRN